MKRIIALLLTVVMLFGTLALDAGAYAVDLIMQKDKDGKDTKEVDYSKTVEQYLTLAFATEEEKLETMEMMYEKDGYQLWVDTLTGEVATKCLASGQILFTNPYDIGNCGASAATKKQIMSQIILEYKDNDTNKKFYSFEEAAQRGQITAKNIKGGIRVEYRIGREETRMLVPRMIEDVRFEELILDPFAEYINGISAENPDKMKVIEWRDYTALAVFNNKTKDSGNDEWFKWNQLSAYYSYKNINECDTVTERNAMLAAYPICSNMNIYVFAPDASATEIARVEGYIKTYAPAYGYEQLEYDHNRTGYSGADKAPALFKLALEYTLDEWGMSVRLPANGLRFNESLYQLNYIEPLPYMGAGANYYQDETKTKFTGYNFFPDGSGTLFRHEELAGTITTQINGKVYGQDFAYNTITGSHQEIIRYPVFGIVSNTTEPVLTVSEEVVKDEDGNVVYNEDGTEKTQEVSTMTMHDESRGFVAIIEEGDALADLSSYHAGSLSKYNIVQMLFYPRPKDSYNLANAISVGANATWTVVSSRKYVGNYKIRYILLTDEQIAKENDIKDYYEVSWMGMAAAYRDYLYSTGELSPLTEKDVKEDLPVYVQTFGTMETVQKIMSVPVNVMTSLTSFENVKTMYDELSDAGVSNVKFKLVGYANGGMYASVPYKLKWEKSVGGKSGYEDLLAYSQEKDFELFPDFDFVYVRASTDSLFDGLSLKEHIVKSINNTYMSKRYYSATKQTYQGRFELAISAAYYSHFYDKLSANLLKFYKDGYTTAISVGTLGTDLNSDFDEDDPANREDSKQSTKELLAKISEDFDDVMSEGANAYTWKYVDYIVNVPLDSSRYIKSSAAVPFIGVVLHGSKQYAGSPLNMDGNIGYSLLKSIENGASLYFILCYDNYAELKEDHHLSQYYSVRYDILKDDVVKYYTVLNDLTRDLQLSKIVGHSFLSGERVPDPDEIIADREAAEKALKEAEEQARIDAEIALRDALNKGRIESLSTATTAMSNMKRYYETVYNCYEGGYSIDASGMVTNTIGMKTLTALLEKDRKDVEKTTQVFDDATVLSDSRSYLQKLWDYTQKNYANSLANGALKAYATLYSNYIKAIDTLNSQKDKMPAQEQNLADIIPFSIEAGIKKVPDLYKAYVAAAEAYAAKPDDTTKAALDAAEDKLTFISGTVDNAKAYSEAAAAAKEAEDALAKYVADVTANDSAAKKALDALIAAAADKYGAEADFKAAAEALDAAVAARDAITSSVNPEFNYWTRIKSTATSSVENMEKTYPGDCEGFSEYVALKKLIEEADAKLPTLNRYSDEYLAAVKEVEDKTADYNAVLDKYVGADADYAAAKAEYEAAHAAYLADVEGEESGRTSDYKALAAAIEKADKAAESAYAKLEKVSPVQSLVDDYLAAAEKRNEAIVANGTLELGYLKTAEYAKLTADVDNARAALAAASKGYESDAAYKTLKEAADKADKAFDDYIAGLKAALADTSKPVSEAADRDMHAKFTIDEEQNAASTALISFYGSLSNINNLKTFDDYIAEAKKIVAASPAADYLAVYAKAGDLLDNAKESNKEGAVNSEKFTTNVEKSRELLAAAQKAAEALAEAEKKSYILADKTAADAKVDEYVTSYVSKLSTNADYKAASDALAAAEKALSDYITKYKADMKASDEAKAAKTAEDDAKKAVTASYARAKEIANELNSTIANYDSAYSKVATYTINVEVADAALVGHKDAAAYEAAAADAKVLTDVAAAIKAESDDAAADLKTAKTAKETAETAEKNVDKAIRTLDKTVSNQIRAMNTFVAQAKTAYDNAEIANKELSGNDQYSAEFKADVADAYKQVKDLVKGVEGAVPADESTDEVAKLGIVAMASKTYEYAVKTVDLSHEYIADISVVMTDPNAEVAPTTDEEEEEEDDGTTKYTDNSGNIVLVKYENGISFILNFNFYSVVVEYNGTSYTIPNSGGVRIDEKNGAEPIVFSATEINK